MTEKKKFIAVVDDDESVRESVPDLLREFGYDSGGFLSAEEFLASDKLRNTDCLVLDLAMPGMSGPELHRELTNLGYRIPVVFITAHGDKAVRDRLRSQGAVDCLLKPFSDTALMETLKIALAAR
jgi:FixJ family two-component response regulator